MRAIDGDAFRNKLQNLADDDWNQDTATSWAEAFSECADMIAILSWGWRNELYREGCRDAENVFGLSISGR